MTATAPAEGPREGERAAEARRLAAIRARVDALDGATWQLGAEGEAMIVEAAGRDGSRVRLLAFDRLATPDEMAIVAGAPDDLRLMLGLVDRAIAALRKPAERPAATARAGRDYAAEAAMKCAEPAFAVYLEERHGLERPLTPERVAQRVRSLTAVASRREFNSDPAAAGRWRDLVRDFDNWRRTGG